MKKERLEDVPEPGCVLQVNQHHPIVAADSCQHHLGRFHPELCSNDMAVEEGEVDDQMKSTHHLRNHKEVTVEPGCLRSSFH